MKSMSPVLLLSIGLLTSSPAPAATPPPPYALPDNLFATEVSGPAPVNGYGPFNLTEDMAIKIEELGVGLVRFNAIRWSDVEKVDGVQNWNVLVNQEAALGWLIERRLKPILIIQGTPGWAQIPWPPDALPKDQIKNECLPIDPDYYSRFAQFTVDVIQHLANQGIPIEFIEIWNEPDATRELDTGFDHMGCWGLDGDPGFGGAVYADLLAAVYPQVKAAFPQVRVVHGGLLYSCENISQGGTFRCGSGAGPAFLGAVLEAGGGRHFDILAFHGYPLWEKPEDSLPERDPDLYYDDGKFFSGGGFLRAKFDSIRATMAQWGVHKPILMNEGSLACTHTHPTYCKPPNDPTQSVHLKFLERQSRFTFPFFARLWSRGVASISWYTMNFSKWGKVGLLDDEANSDPRPAYDAYRHLTSRLTGAIYVGPVTHGEAEGHRFCKGNEDLRMFWTNRIGTYSSLPPGLPANTRFFHRSGYEHQTPPIISFENPILAVAELDHPCSTSHGPILKLTPDLRTASDGWAGDKWQVVTGDWNGDGRKDLAFLPKVNGLDAYVVFGSAGGFGTRKTVTNSFGMNAGRWLTTNGVATVGDFDGDGKDDLLLRPRPTNWLAFLLRGAAGATGFETVRDVTNQAGMSPALWADQNRIAIAGDWNGDGRTDLVLQQRIVGSSTHLLFGQAGATPFGAQQTITSSFGTSAYHWSAEHRVIYAGDWDGDGRDDLVLQQKQVAGANTFALYGAVAGGFGTAITVTNTNALTAELWADVNRKITTGDWNGDGKTDLLLQQRSATGTTLYQPGDLGFHHFYADVTNEWGMTANHWALSGRRTLSGDFDGDGVDDLLLGQLDPLHNSFLLLSDRGNFEPVQQITTAWRTDGYRFSPQLSALVPGDFNGDGADDVFFQQATEKIQNVWQDSYLLLSREP